MKFIRDYLNTQITSPADPVILANITKESDITNGKIHLSLIQVEEERIGREVIHRRRLNPTDDFYTVINPEIHLNLYILFTYQYTGKNYEEALKQLSQVITTLQGKNVFTEVDFAKDASTKDAYKPLQQIVVELYTQSLDQNSNLWQALGEKLSPSLLYKVRVIGIQANRVLSTTAEIKTIGVDVEHKPFES